MSKQIENSAVQPIGRHLLVDQIAKGLRDAILSGELGPGERLFERDWSKRFGVSRYPLREAFVMLRGEGLLRTFPHNGTFVTEITQREAEALYGVKALMDGYAARMAAEGHDLTQIKTLWDILREMESETKTKSMDVFLRLSRGFHGSLIELSDNPFLISWYRGVEILCHRCRILSLNLPERMEANIIEHQEILQAIEKGDPHEAEMCTRTHVEATGKRVVSVLRETEGIEGSAKLGSPII